jgi:hypothetical protein
MAAGAAKKSMIWIEIVLLGALQKNTVSDYA